MGEDDHRLDGQNLGNQRVRMNLIRKLFDRDSAAQQRIFFSVRPIQHVGYGVYAHAILIGIHADHATATAHCQRLRNQQAQE